MAKRRKLKLYLDTSVLGFAINRAIGSAGTRQSAAQADQDGLLFWGFFIGHGGRG